MTAAAATAGKRAPAVPLTRIRAALAVLDDLARDDGHRDPELDAVRDQLAHVRGALEAIVVRRARPRPGAEPPRPRTAADQPSAVKPPQAGAPLVAPGKTGATARTAPATAAVRTAQATAPIPAHPPRIVPRAALSAATAPSAPRPATASPGSTVAQRPAGRPRTATPPRTIWWSWRRVRTLLAGAGAALACLAAIAWLLLAEPVAWAGETAAIAAAALAAGGCAGPAVRRRRAVRWHVRPRRRGP